MEQMLTHTTKIVTIAVPNNYTGAAGTTEWISLKGYDRARFIIQTGAWAGGTAAVTLNQATDVAGTGSASLGFAEYYTGTGDTLTRTTATSDTFNLAAANTKYVIEVKGADLTSPDDCVNLAIASPGSNDDYYCAIAELYGARYEGSLPTSITD